MILERPEEPGKKYALAFTFVVHAGLILALFLGVQWKRSPPEAMEVTEVELWSSRPTPATQVLPPPPPEVKPEPPKPVPKVEPKPEPLPPKQPDIVTKEEKKPPKPELKKPEAKPEIKKPEVKPEIKKPEVKPEVKPEAKPKPTVPDFSKELSRETSDLKPRANAQQLANVAAAESEQRAASNKRGLADYAAKIRGKVRGNIVLPPSIQGNPEAIFAVDQLPSGEILAVKLKRSSGNPGLDAAIERAILKSSPLPKPDDPALFQRELKINYKPFEE
ncbi:MAG: TonB C-terminal domain-containing protein [Azonexus sp.]|jgi:colicin import membrane protein|nr:TonB C-terminal domain-containing protein [Azonexus sp.]